MSLFNKRFRLPLQRKNASGTQKEDLVPYEQREKVEALSLVITICNRHQDHFFLDNYALCGASLSVTLYARSDPPEDIVALLGFVDTKKDVLLTIARSEYVDRMLSIASKRFAVSSEAKGIAFSLPISEVAGVSVYRFLADQQKEIRIAKQQEGN